MRDLAERLWKDLIGPCPTCGTNLRLARRDISCPLSNLQRDLPGLVLATQRLCEQILNEVRVGFMWPL